jgi:hypothetical protein
MNARLEKNIELVDIADAATPRDGVFRVIVDAWWIVKDEKIMMYRGFSPQCNRDRKLAESVRKKLYPECELRQLPAVYVPWKD